MSKETMQRERLEPRTSRSGVLGVNCLATHASTYTDNPSNPLEFPIFF